MECVFCKIAKGEIGVNVIYRDDVLTCFLDYEPINEGHVLIIPNSHYLDADELPDDVAVAIMKLSMRLVSIYKEKYHPEGYSIMQNGGRFNDVGHYHMHVFPRYTDDGFGWTYSDEKHSATESIARSLKEILIGSGLDSAERPEGGMAFI